MTFWLDYPSITVIGVGLDADKPTRPESLQHGFWANDAKKLYLAGRDRTWAEASGGLGTFPQPVASVTTVPIGRQAIVLAPVIDAELIIDGELVVLC